jgi:hypothetical protein
MSEIDELRLFGADEIHIDLDAVQLLDQIGAKHADQLRSTARMIAEQHGATVTSKHHVIAAHLAIEAGRRPLSDAEKVAVAARERSARRRRQLENVLFTMLGVAGSSFVAVLLASSLDTKSTAALVVFFLLSVVLLWIALSGRDDSGAAQH